MRTRLLLTALTALTALAAPAALAQDQRPVVTLEEAIRLGTRVQPTVVQAEGGVRNASAQLRAARGQFLPNVNATTSVGTSFSERSRVEGGQISDPGSTTSASMGVSGSVDLFTGFRRGADIRAARAQGVAADATLTDAQSQSRLNTTQEFFNALYARQLIAVRDAGVRRAEEQLKIAVAKLASGSATRSDSLRSLVTLGTARLQLVNAQAQLSEAEANLGRLVGLETGVAAADDSSYYQVLTAIDSSALRTEAIARSPRVLNTEASRDAARASLSAARSAYWPTLSLNGNYNYSGNGNRDTDLSLLNNRSLTLQLSWPLFNRFTRERNITTQEVNLDAAVATADDSRRQIQASLTTQLGLLDAARVRIDITQISVRAAQEDLRVQQERYRLGAATIVELLTSQEALSQAEVDAINARFDYLRAKAQIEALIGRPL